MRISLAPFTLVVLVGCTCGTDAPPVAPAPLPSIATVAEATAAVPSSSPEEAPPPAPAIARAFLSRLRQARALAHRGEHAHAYELFAALVRERPGSARLRCEAGYVAHLAQRTEDAEREISLALARWSRPPPARDRAPLAMCLYNRGLIAQSRGDDSSALRVWRESLELRPNRIVEEHIAALGFTEEEEAEEAAHADGIFDLAELIAQLRRTSGATDPPDLIEVASEHSARVASRATFALPDEDEVNVDCVEQALLLSSPEGALQLSPSISECRMYSYFDDRADMGSPTFHVGPDALGEIVAVVTSTYGRGDSEDGRGIEAYEDSTLHLCAERLQFRCVEIALSATATTDCEGSGDCGDSEDPEDDEGPRTPSSRGFALSWSIDGGDLVLVSNETREQVTAPTTPPRQGRVPLTALFAE